MQEIVTSGFPEVSYTQPLLVGVRPQPMPAKARCNKPVHLLQIPCPSIPGVWHRKNTFVTQRATPDRIPLLPRIPQAVDLHQVKRNFKQDRKELNQEECVQLCLPLTSPHRGKKIVLIVKPHTSFCLRDEYLRVYRTRTSLRGINFHGCRRAGFLAAKILHLVQVLGSAEFERAKVAHFEHDKLYSWHR